MNPVPMLHTAPREERESIEDRGLLARLPCDCNWPALNRQPRGAYLLEFGQHPWERGVLGWVDKDVWVADVAGIALEPDPKVENAWVAPAGVPPGRLRLADPGIGLDWPEPARRFPVPF